MVEIRMLPAGRYEVFAEGRHQESFEGRFGAIVVAEAVAGELAKECRAVVTITAPWGEHSVSEAGLVALNV